jgi:hypothetical protein
MPLRIAEGRESGYDSDEERRDRKSRDAARQRAIANRDPGAAMAPPLPPLPASSGQSVFDPVFDDVASVTSDDDGYQCGAYEIGDVDC